MSAETPQPEQTPQDRERVIVEFHQRRKRVILEFLEHVDARDCVCRQGIICDPWRKACDEYRAALAALDSLYTR